MSKSKKFDVEDAEDHEIFDINDFTTASDWERFVVQIEELINEWKLNSSDQINLQDVDFLNGEWEQKEETIQFADEISFTFTFYSLNLKNDNKPYQPEKLKYKQSDKQMQNDSDSVDFDSLSLSKPNQNLDINEQSKTLINLPPKPMADLLNKTNDFQTVSSSQATTPSLAYWYGLCKFVIISPTRSNNHIDTEGRANVVLSSISIAINNTGCQIPIFVQVNSFSRDMYLGLCEGSALKTHFQIVHFNYTPSQYAYLPGLLEIFKSKLGNHLANSSLLISVSVRFTYLIQESTFLDWQQQSTKPSYESKSFQEVELIDDKIEDIYPDLKSLPFGTTQDCIDSIYLSCVWSNLSEDIIVDSESYTDLNPNHSNDWSLTINNISERCDYELSNSLYKYIDELKRTISVYQLLGPVNLNINSETDSQIEELKQKSLSKLTNSTSASRRLDKMYSLSSNIVEKATNKMKILNINDQLLPLDKGFLDFIMDYLFPDANLRKQKDFKIKHSEKSDLNENMRLFLKKISLIKSSTNDYYNGLLNKLVLCLNLVNRIGQTRAIAQLWKEFVLELRYRYESSILIPGMCDSVKNDYISSKLSKTSNNNNNNNQETAFIPPDLSRCLLHQKIQMLNCCIKKKIERQTQELMSVNRQEEKENVLKKSNQNPEDDEEDEDQFFDCEDDENSSDNQNFTPEGRLKKFGDLTLLKKPTEPLYVPITQESTPMTEDMLEQHASVLLNIGSGDDASLLRAKIQSASLLSDMQSFKAANPECVLEDFVRWYSPRDWVEVEEKEVDCETSEEKLIKKYDLSNRMKITGNVWVEAWKNAKPVPVRRQKRLFDDTKEAENVFEWLNSLSIGQIIEQTLPILFYSSIYLCYEEANLLELNSFVDPIFDSLIDKAIKISRNNETKKYQELINYIKSIEQIVSVMKSLNSKFLNKKSKLDNQAELEVKDFLKKLLKLSIENESCEVKIENGAHGTIGKLISKLCSKKKSSQKIRNAQSNEYKSLSDYQDNDNNLDDDDDLDEQAKDNFNNVLLPYDKPFKREYILRSSVPRPAPYSRQSPQRMYCLINNLEFRLAGAFTEDTMFF